MTLLADVVTAVRITGPLTLAGHSMGGMTALAYFGRPASMRPVEPRGLVLVGTAARGLAERGIGRLLASPATGALFGLVHRMPRGATDRAVEKITQPVGAALGKVAGDRSAVAAVAAALSGCALASATPAWAAQGEAAGGPVIEEVIVSVERIEQAGEDGVRGALGGPPVAIGDQAER